MQDSIFLDSFDIVNSKTNKEVHGDDGHGDHEDDEEYAGGPLIGHSYKIQEIIAFEIHNTQSSILLPGLAFFMGYKLQKVFQWF